MHSSPERTAFNAHLFSQRALCSALTSTAKSSQALIGSQGHPVLTCLSSTPCAADAMHVVLSRQWERVVDDCLHIGDIQSTSRHISSHKQGDLAALELRNRARALLLRGVTMDGHCLQAHKRGVKKMPQRITKSLCFCLYSWRRAQQRPAARGEQQ